MELRTRFNYAWKLNSEDDDLDSAEDLRFGVKYQLTEQCGHRPESAVEFRLSVPSGGSAFTTGGWEPGFDYIYSGHVGEKFTLSGSSGANGSALGDVSFFDLESDPDDEFIVWTQSLAFGARMTDRTTGYIEWFGLYTDQRDDELILSYLNLGVDYLLNPNTVVDIRLGWGLNDDSDDLFAGIGGAIRF
jgi:hypothetical protein